MDKLSKGFKKTTKKLEKKVDDMTKRFRNATRWEKNEPQQENNQQPIVQELQQINNQQPIVQELQQINNQQQNHQQSDTNISDSVQEQQNDSIEGKSIQQNKQNEIGISTSAYESTSKFVDTSSSEAFVDSSEKVEVQKKIEKLKELVESAKKDADEVRKFLKDHREELSCIEEFNKYKGIFYSDLGEIGAWVSAAENHTKNKELRLIKLELVDKASKQLNKYYSNLSSNFETFMTFMISECEAKKNEINNSLELKSQVEAALKDHLPAHSRALTDYLTEKLKKYDQSLEKFRSWVKGKNAQESLGDLVKKYKDMKEHLDAWNNDLDQLVGIAEALDNLDTTYRQITAEASKHVGKFREIVEQASLWQFSQPFVERYGEVRNYLGDETVLRQKLGESESSQKLDDDEKALSENFQKIFQVLIDEQSHEAKESLEKIYTATTEIVRDAELSCILTSGSNEEKEALDGMEQVKSRVPQDRVTELALYRELIAKVLGKDGAKDRSVKGLVDQANTFEKKHEIVELIAKVLGKKDEEIDISVEGLVGRANTFEKKHEIVDAMVKIGKEYEDEWKELNTTILLAFREELKGKLQGRIDTLKTRTETFENEVNDMEQKWPNSKAYLESLLGKLPSQEQLTDTPDTEKSLRQDLAAAQAALNQEDISGTKLWEWCQQMDKHNQNLSQELTEVQEAIKVQEAFDKELQQIKTISNELVEQKTDDFFTTFQTRWEKFEQGQKKLVQCIEDTEKYFQKQSVSEDLRKLSRVEDNKRALSKELHQMVVKIATTMDKEIAKRGYNCKSWQKDTRWISNLQFVQDLEPSISKFVDSYIKAANSSESSYVDFTNQETTIGELVANLPTAFEQFDKFQKKWKILNDFVTNHTTLEKVHNRLIELLSKSSQTNLSIEKTDLSTEKSKSLLEQTQKILESVMELTPGAESLKEAKERIKKLWDNQWIMKVEEDPSMVDSSTSSSSDTQIRLKVMIDSAKERAGSLETNLDNVRYPCLKIIKEIETSTVKQFNNIYKEFSKVFNFLASFKTLQEELKDNIPLLDRAESLSKDLDQLKSSRQALQNWFPQNITGNEDFQSVYKKNKTKMEESLEILSASNQIRNDIMELSKYEISKYEISDDFMLNNKVELYIKVENNYPHLTSKIYKTYSECDNEICRLELQVDVPLRQRDYSVKANICTEGWKEISRILSEGYSSETLTNFSKLIESLLQDPRQLSSRESTDDLVPYRSFSGNSPSSPDRSIRSFFSNSPTNRDSSTYQLSKSPDQIKELYRSSAIPIRDSSYSQQYRGFSDRDNNWMMNVSGSDTRQGERWGSMGSVRSDTTVVSVVDTSIESLEASIKNFSQKSQQLYNSFKEVVIKDCIPWANTIIIDFTNRVNSYDQKNEAFTQSTIYTSFKQSCNRLQRQIKAADSYCEEHSDESQKNFEDLQRQLRLLEALGQDVVQQAKTVSDAIEFVRTASQENRNKINGYLQDHGWLKSLEMYNDQKLTSLFHELQEYSQSHQGRSESKIHNEDKMIENQLKLFEYDRKFKEAIEVRAFGTNSQVLVEGDHQKINEAYIDMLLTSQLNSQPVNLYFKKEFAFFYGKDQNDFIVQESMKTFQKKYSDFSFISPNSLAPCEKAEETLKEIQKEIEKQAIDEIERIQELYMQAHQFNLLIEKDPSKMSCLERSIEESKNSLPSLKNWFGLPKAENAEIFFRNVNKNQESLIQLLEDSNKSRNIRVKTERKTYKSVKSKISVYNHKNERIKNEYLKSAYNVYSVNMDKKLNEMEEINLINNAMMYDESITSLLKEFPEVQPTEIAGYAENFSERINSYLQTDQKTNRQENSLGMPDVVNSLDESLTLRNIQDQFKQLDTSYINTLGEYCMLLVTKKDSLINKFLEQGGEDSVLIENSKVYKRFSQSNEKFQTYISGTRKYLREIQARRIKVMDLEKELQKVNARYQELTRERFDRVKEAVEFARTSPQDRKKEIEKFCTENKDIIDIIAGFNATRYFQRDFADFTTVYTNVQGSENQEAIRQQLFDYQMALCEPFHKLQEIIKLAKANTECNKVVEELKPHAQSLSKKDHEKIMKAYINAYTREQFTIRLQNREKKFTLTDRSKEIISKASSSTLENTLKHLESEYGEKQVTRDFACVWGMRTMESAKQIPYSDTTQDFFNFYKFDESLNASPSKFPVKLSTVEYGEGGSFCDVYKEEGCIEVHLVNTHDLRKRNIPVLSHSEMLWYTLLYTISQREEEGRTFNEETIKEITSSSLKKEDFDIKVVEHTQIANEHTKYVRQLVANENREVFKKGSDEYMSMLGTPNCQGVAFLLEQHRDFFGEKEITAISVDYGMTSVGKIFKRLKMHIDDGM